MSILGRWKFRWKLYRIQSEANRRWKNEKRMKWLAEGMSSKEVEKKLKVYKVSMPPMFILGFICGMIVLGVIIYKILTY